MDGTGITAANRTTESPLYTTLTCTLTIASNALTGLQSHHDQRRRHKLASDRNEHGSMTLTSKKSYGDSSLHSE